MNLTDTTLDNFINEIIEYDNIDDILDSCKNQSEQGFVFERLFDIVIKFGFCDIFPNSKFNHLIGNSNNGKLKVLQNLDTYCSTEKVISGNSGGCSDITLQNKIDDTFIFITSKYPKTSDDIKKQKSVDYYDIQKIIAMATKNNYIYKNYKIFIVVPNKKKVLDKVKNTNNSSQYITEHMTENNILDKDDLNKYFLRFKQDIIKNKNKDWNELYLSPKESLILRFHQELITRKTSNLISEGNKSFLWGCKCRSGKTYMIGGIIIKQLNIKKKLNVLIITPAPTETAPQFTDELFHKFKDFDKFKIHHIENSKSINNIELIDNNIFVISKQLLQKYIGDDTILKIKNLKLDIIGFDENHFSGTTDLSKDILFSYSSKNTVKIYLTATYNKPLKEWNILPECQMFWDIEDEQICKSICDDEMNINKLKDKHGENYVNSTVKYFKKLEYSIVDIFKPYLNMPELHIITNMFDSQRYGIIRENIMNSVYGFSFDVLFSLDKKKEKFNYRDEVKLVLRYISGSNKENDFKDGDKSIYTRINRTCSRPVFTQIWFLPSDNINEISKCLKQLMLEDSMLKNYDIMRINRKNKELARDIKDEINKKEIEAKSKGKKGLILLAGNMLSLGITLNLCDLVILMNNTLSSDKVLQQMYRSMTEGNNKKIGFVVDLNISRVINTCMNYTIYKNDKSLEDKIKYLIENHLINIDVDMMENKKIDSDVIVKKLMNIWKEDPINNIQMYVKSLTNEIMIFDNPTQKIVNNTFSKLIGDRKINVKLLMKDNDDELQELPSGKNNNVITDNDSENSNSDTESDEDVGISFTKDVLTCIIPLSCIITMENKNTDFMKMLNDIKNNKEFLEVFDDQCDVWWDKKELINIIEKIVGEYYDKNSNIFNTAICIKMSIQSLLDNPKELLELINDCLKPKTIEKQQFGEVFTPMKIVNEMLDKLPKEVWTNKSLKWFDPASGMGNFPIAVYLRLMEGLKTEIKNDKTRKKHILENMLYMCELNKKNVFICRQIFDINNEYKLNLYGGDTLEFNPFETFKIKQFDIIIGNPPYNKGGIRSHTGKYLGDKNETIWTKFIEKSFEWLKPNGYLTFINPLSWLKKSHSLHYVMLEKHIIWIKLWDNIKSLATINGKIPISIYVLQNKLNIDKNKTEIISEIQSKKLTTTSNVYLDKKHSVPLAYHSIFDKLINFIETNNLKLEYRTKTVKSNGDKTKLPKKYELDNMFAVDTYTIKEGIMVKKTNEKHPDANKRKLIIANKSSFNGAFIDEGKLGLTGNDKTYIIGDNLELVLKMLKFRISDIISHFTKYRQDFLEKEVYTYLPDIRKLKIKDISEKQFYDLIGLTQNEINMFDTHNLTKNNKLVATQNVKIKTQYKEQYKDIIDDMSDDDIIEIKSKKSVKK